MIAIIDYGVGNLFSLQSSFAAIGQEAVVTADPNIIRSADRIILPGVGAFEDAARKLRDSGMAALVTEQAAAGKPVMGICLGMRCMVIEFARDVLGLADANSTEMEPNTAHKVIDLMEEQKNVTNMGGSMRLGAYDCTLKEGSKVLEAYGKEHIQERHRHRFEFNNEYKKQYEAAGMMCTGENPETNLVEVVEIPALKWFVGVQYHPEFKSRPNRPHPLFKGFIAAALEGQQ